MIRALLTAVACVGLGAPAGWAQDSPDEGTAPESLSPRIAALRAGFDGHFKVGYWTPFVIELEGGSQPLAGRVELVVPDGDGVPTRVVAPAEGDLTLGAGERKTVRLYARLGQLAAEVTVGFRGPAGLLAARQFTTQSDGPLRDILPSSETLVVSLAASDDREASARALRGVQSAAISRLDELPGDWWGYEGLDAVIVNTADDAISSQLAAPSPQLAALDQWVRMGGTLVVSVGRNAEKLLAAGSPLADLAPGTFEALVPLRQSSVLEMYVETSEPISPDAPFEILVPQLRDARGKVEAYAGTHPRDLPLVVRAPRGFGQVVFAAFDLDRAPFAGWVARPQLVDKLLRGVRPAEHAESAGLGAVASLGFNDLAGQLRAALDQFDGVRPVPFWLAALLVAVYIAIIGPLDYYLVKHVFRRMEATWITFGVTVLVFCAAAYALAYALKGSHVRTNELDVVDFDAASGLERGTSWSNVFSPRNETYNLSLATQPPVRGPHAGMLLSWFGLPGSGFGGMDVPPRSIGGITTASRTLPLFVEAYDYSPRLDALAHVPIAVWSSKAFVGRWWREARPPVEARLADRDKLTGTLTNRLATPLFNAVLIYDKWAYVIGTLEAGRELDVESVDPQTVDTYLRRVQARGDRQVAAAYDREAFDVPRIVEMMTAHDLAGGANYTALANKYEGFDELSSLVQNGRAVLVAQCDQRAARLQRDGAPLAGTKQEGAQSRAWTFHRCVFPVAVDDSE